jgi:pimeloyl-ACP methyl ester carboxylesterase
LVYVFFVVVLFALQNRLIFPGQDSQGRAEAVVHPPLGAELVNLETAAGERVVAVFGRALTPDGKPRADAALRPTIVYFYGNAMCANTALDEFESFRRLGANVMIPDYLGYGMSGGRASETGCYATAEACYQHLITRRDIDPRKIVAAGWSLGGAVAIDLASRQPVAGLATFSTFTSLPETARTHFRFVPVSLLLRYRFESEHKIAKVHVPTLIGHGKRDNIIPSEMSDRLAKAAGGTVTQVTIAAAGHNDFFLAGGPEIERALARLLDAL